MPRDYTVEGLWSLQKMYSPRRFGETILNGMQKQLEKKLSRQAATIKNLEKKVSQKPQGKKKNLFVLNKVPTRDLFAELWRLAAMDPFDPRVRGIIPPWLAAEGFTPFTYAVTFQVVATGNGQGGYSIIPNPCLFAVFQPGCAPASGNPLGGYNIVLQTGNILTNFSTTAAAGNSGLSSNGGSWVLLCSGYRKRSVQQTSITSCTARTARVAVTTPNPYSTDVFKTGGGTSTMSFNDIQDAYFNSSTYNTDVESLPGRLQRFTTYDVMQAAAQFNFDATTPDAFKVRLTNDQGNWAGNNIYEYSMLAMDVSTGALQNKYQTQVNGPLSCDGWSGYHHQLTNMSAGATIFEIEMLFNLAIQPLPPVTNGTQAAAVPSAVIQSNSVLRSATDLYNSASSVIKTGVRLVDTFNRLKQAPSRAVPLLMSAVNQF